ncbi:superoxide dismutase, Cu-Zn family [Flavobacteriaceae bacterium MAR_2010_188]|nr:superoxide dismutase, Cu-Zn family [Flavobacteriaceae bacterium MAR_2010_188]
MKKSIIILFLSSLFLTNVSCKDDKKDADDMMDDTEMMEADDNMDMDNDDMMATKKITVDLISKSNSTVTGNAVFTVENGKVTMVAALSGLKPGTHAIHLHETADCSAADATSSGGHWNPTGTQHGKWGDAKGYHKGDIGNFEANANGNASTRFETDEWCIGCGDPSKDITGKAVVVHEGTDDFTSQPAGNAGARVSCGGVIQ